MPGSSTLCNNYLIEDLKQIQPKTIYELGIGRGMMAKLTRDVLPDVHVTGFEIFEQYIKDHNPKWYNKIIIADYWKWIQESIDWTVDLILIPDSIEHLLLSRALDVLDMVQQRCKWIIIKTPLKYKQNTHFGNIYEGHISELTLPKLINYDIRKYIIEEEDTWAMSYIKIKGWL